MKFHFCGDSDVPEWVLRECAALARLSAVRVRILAGFVCASVADDAAKIDFAKVKRLLSVLGTSGGLDGDVDENDDDVSAAEAKPILAALRFIFASSARSGVTHDVLMDEIQQLGLPKEHGLAISRPFQQQRDALRANLAGKTLRLSRVSAVLWRVDLVLTSSHLESVMAPVVQLKIERGKENAPVAFEVAGDRFRVLLSELKAARRAMET